MRSEHNNQTANVIGSAAKPWSLGLDVCALGITPFFVVDQTARTGP